MASGSAPTIQGYRQFEVEKEDVEALFDRELAAGRHNLIELKALEALQSLRVPDRQVQVGDDGGRGGGGGAGDGLSGRDEDRGARRFSTRRKWAESSWTWRNEEAVRTAYATMLDSVRRRMGNDVEIWGVVIQQMLERGKEVILGVTRDERFGPVLMFGLGGIYAETFRDVAFRLAPIRENVAEEMIHDIRSIKLLEGVRGEPPSDLAAVAECLLRLSQFVTEHPRISELDINPLLVYPRGKGAMVADARIILAEK